MCWRGRGSAVPRKEKPRSGKHWRQCEMKRQQRGFSACWLGGGELEMKRQRKKKEWGKK
jgi:hypothetical protein